MTFNAIKIPLYIHTLTGLTMGKDTNIMPVDCGLEHRFDHVEYFSLCGMRRKDFIEYELLCLAS